MALSFLRAGASKLAPSPLRPYLQRYLRIVRTQLTILKNGTTNMTPTLLADIAAKADAESDWADLFAMEDALIAALPDEQLNHAVFAWRTRYRQIVGAALFDEYLKSKPPDPNAATPPTASAMRQDILALAARIHYAYAFNPPRERMRNRLAIFNALLIVIVGVAAIAPALALKPAWPIFFLRDDCTRWGCLDYSSLQIIVLAGLIGGFISVQQRLQSWSDVDPLYKRLEISAGWFSVVAVAPLTGAVFAIVLFFLFFAGALSGGLFPHFAADSYMPSHGVPGASFADFVHYSRPYAPVDWAKIVLWSFIAGFAERFVPDVLSRLASVQYALGGSAAKAG